MVKPRGGWRSKFAFWRNLVKNWTKTSRRRARNTGKNPKRWSTRSCQCRRCTAGRRSRRRLRKFSQIGWALTWAKAKLAAPQKSCPPPGGAPTRAASGSARRAGSGWAAWSSEWTCKWGLPSTCSSSSRSCSCPRRSIIGTPPSGRARWPISAGGSAPGSDLGIAEGTGKWPKNRPRKSPTPTHMNKWRAPANLLMTHTWSRGKSERKCCARPRRTSAQRAPRRANSPTPVANRRTRSCRRRASGDRREAPKTHKTLMIILLRIFWTKFEILQN